MAVRKVNGSPRAVIVWSGSDAAAEAAVKKEVRSPIVATQSKHDLFKAVPKVKGSPRAVIVWSGSDAAAEAAVRKDVCF